MSDYMSDNDRDDLAAEQDRRERPYVVGEVAHPGVIERFATAEEAAEYIRDQFPAEEVLAGDYYIDGPEQS